MSRRERESQCLNSAVTARCGKSSTNGRSTKDALNVAGSSHTRAYLFKGKFLQVAR